MTTIDEILHGSSGAEIVLRSSSWLIEMGSGWSRIHFEWLYDFVHIQGTCVGARRQ